MMTLGNNNIDSISDALYTCIKSGGGKDNLCGAQTINGGSFDSIFDTAGAPLNAIYPCDGQAPGPGTCPEGYLLLDLQMTANNSDGAVDTLRTCLRNVACGDGELDPGEACDDENLLPGDGLSLIHI